MSQQCIQLPRDSWFNLAEKIEDFHLVSKTHLSRFLLLIKTHLGRRIVCVADARTPGGEVEECEVPKVWSSGETVLAGGGRQLPGAGEGAVTPVTVKCQQIFLQFDRGSGY